PFYSRETEGPDQRSPKPGPGPDQIVRRFIKDRQETVNRNHPQVSKPYQPPIALGQAPGHCCEQYLTTPATQPVKNEANPHTKPVLPRSPQALAPPEPKLSPAVCPLLFVRKANRETQQPPCHPRCLFSCCRAFKPMTTGQAARRRPARALRRQIE